MHCSMIAINGLSLWRQATVNPVKIKTLYLISLLGLAKSATEYFQIGCMCGWAYEQHFPPDW